MDGILDIMQDASELIHYDMHGIPLYIRVRQLSWYPDMKALCHWHDDLEFIHILKGQMNYYVNGKNILIKENDGIMINTRQLHYGYSDRDTDCTFSCILIHPSLLTNNQELQQEYLSPIIDNKSLEYVYLDSALKETSRLLSLLDDMTALKTQENTGYQLEAIGLMHLIWANIYRLLPIGTLKIDANNFSSIAIQKDMVSFIYQNYTTKLTLADIASSGGVCKSKCCQIFKHYLQQSPIDFLNAYRLDISKDLLLNTSKTIADVALSCGFQHQSYYTELFHRRFGCTPKEYRRK